MSDNIEDQLSEFWKSLRRQLNVKPNRDGVMDVFRENRHLASLIEADAKENAEHAELLARALAIRDGG